ncbi:hypothetical protein GCM10023116_00760 [Kistimonas scapharcae]|uniref:Phospholipase A1 n=1 Tax=Kistimonas scapharcae TaxID=1036133 RepID=A0ABP8UVN2_9GAMM
MNWNHAHVLASLCAMLGFANMSVSSTATTALHEPTDSESDLFILKPYRTNYLLPAHHSQKPNQAFFAPLNPNDRNVKRTEIEFQLSLRFAFAGNLFKPDDTLQFAYTQNSFWQAYDKSAYFRDTDYQPELFYTLPMNHTWGEWVWRSASAGFLHESNGKGGDNEHSWNRVYLDFLLENGNVAISLKPWVRLKITNHDYNKDISHYRGDGELQLHYTLNNHQMIFKSRNNLGSLFSRGYEEFTWLFPIHRNLQGMIKLTSGYGESISDYNHYNNTFGFGVAFSHWQL